MIVGLTGTNAAGKGEVANFLVEKGFSYFSLSDVLREEATKRGLDHSRKALQELGRKLREEEGPAVLAKKALSSLKENTVVDSIRSPAEVEALRQKEGFVLIAIDAPIEVRFERAKSRGRVESVATLEDFKKEEEVENSENPMFQQLRKAMALADFGVINDASVEDLRKKVGAVLGLP